MAGLPREPYTRDIELEAHWQSNYIDEMIDDAALRLVRECKNDWWNGPKGSFNKKPTIGFMTVDYDDESSAQMLEIMKYFKKYD